MKNNDKPSLVDDIEHTIGNALFAIETNLQPLQLRIQQNRHVECTEILCEIQMSIEKAKYGLQKWKELQNDKKI